MTEPPRPPVLLTMGRDLFAAFARAERLGRGFSAAEAAYVMAECRAALAEIANVNVDLQAARSERDWALAEIARLQRELKDAQETLRLYDQPEE